MKFEHYLNENQLYNYLKNVLTKANVFYYLFNPDNKIKKCLNKRNGIIYDSHVHLGDAYVEHGSPHKLKRFWEGDNNLKEIYDNASGKNIKVLGLTSHFNFRCLGNILDYFDKRNCKEEKTIIPVLNMEINNKKSRGINKGHNQIAVFGLNRKNAKKAESLSKIFPNNKLTLPELRRGIDDLNNGKKIINGCYVDEEIRSDLFGMLVPVHFNSMRGIGLESIVNFYRQGYYLDAVEEVNPSSLLFIEGLGEILKTSGFGGSDAHNVQTIGAGFTTIKRKSVESDLDVYDAIMNRDVESDYYRDCSNISRAFNSRKRGTSPYWLVKFIPWLSMEKNGKNNGEFKDLNNPENIFFNIHKDYNNFVKKYLTEEVLMERLDDKFRNLEQEFYSISSRFVKEYGSIGSEMSDSINDLFFRMDELKNDLEEAGIIY